MGFEYVLGFVVLWCILCNCSLIWDVEFTINISLLYCLLLGCFGLEWCCDYGWCFLGSWHLRF